MTTVGQDAKNRSGLIALGASTWAASAFQVQPNRAAAGPRFVPERTLPRQLWIGGVGQATWFQRRLLTLRPRGDSAANLMRRGFRRATGDGMRRRERP